MGIRDMHNVSYDLATRTFQVTHQYLDDKPTGDSDDDFTATVTVIDDDGGDVKDSASVTIANLAPTITGIAASQTVIDLSLIHISVPTRPY